MERQDLRQQTIDTYNKSAKEFAEYFRGIGPRTKDIDFALQAAGKGKQSRVLEIGCGDGRDAKDIVKKVDWYQGFDISEELIRLARGHVYSGKFEVADAVNFDYPKNTDVIFAFASLLHLNKDEVKTVFEKSGEALNKGGIFYISLKWSPEYCQKIKEDVYGRRIFYFYNAEIIQKIAGADYELIGEWRKTIGHTEWFEIALKKI